MNGRVQFTTISVILILNGMNGVLDLPFYAVNVKLAEENLANNRSLNEICPRGTNVLIIL